MKKVVYAGSFDPLTNGHLWIIEEASKLFDQVVVVIALNPTKKYLFSEEVRSSIIRLSTNHLPNIEIHTVSQEYLVDYANKINANYIIRGIRSEKDFSEEKLICNINTELQPNIKSIFLIPPKHLEEVSSSFVKAMIGYISWPDKVSNLVPKSSLNHLFIEYLKPKWQDLMSRLGSRKNTNLNILFDQIITHYSAKGRYYHDLSHLVTVLDMLHFSKMNKFKANDYDLVELALWFHDFFDDTKQYEKVMEVTQNIISNQLVNEEDKDYIKKLIQATFHQLKDFELEDQKLISDVDLSILGSSLDSYNKYAEKIRKEYPQASDYEFNVGRSKVLKYFRDKKIYHTPFFESRENIAKENIKQELNKLSEELNGIQKEQDTQNLQKELKQLKKKISKLEKKETNE